MHNVKQKNYHPVDVVFEQLGPRIYTSEDDLSAELKFYYNLLKLDSTPDVSGLYSIVSNNITLKNCTQEILEILEYKLNPPVIDSMKNWEYLTSKFGCSNDFVMNMRSHSNPMREFIKSNGDIKLNMLLKEIESMNRIDVLLSLEKPLNKLKSCVNRKLSDSKNQTKLLVCKKTFPSSEDISILNHDKDFILILHHEVEAKDRKYFKWFRRNLENASDGKYLIFDFDKSVDKSNLYLSTKSLFQSSLFIICLYNDEWCKVINSFAKTNSESINLTELLKCKVYLSELMDGEIIQNKFVNKRFVAVTVENFNKSLLPVGWPQNTLCYEFPKHFKDLCTKVLK
ncbi:Death-like domain-containing protein [Strongyloides ratti]|uniref:Death-like domain-containing protein n=1 Tax=Strongyloides ratti TaxID=34506 RepID=A0A090KR60_STRRB|nr:Death-like domain-containing protein [Strongyloides ratti]CEF60009.1 Death-like domain-containing protein [Strongyloides ratti]